MNLVQWEEAFKCTEYNFHFLEEVGRNLQKKGTSVRQGYIRYQGAAGVIINVWSENILKLPKKGFLV